MSTTHGQNPIVGEKLKDALCNTCTVHRTACAAYGHEHSDYRKPRIQRWEAESRHASHIHTTTMKPACRIALNASCEDAVVVVVQAAPASFSKAKVPQDDQVGTW
jgi:hypothetical protein